MSIGFRSSGCCSLARSCSSRLGFQLRWRICIVPRFFHCIVLFCADLVAIGIMRFVLGSLLPFLPWYGGGLMLEGMYT